MYEHPLRRLRREAGLTQVMLARASGVGRVVTINRIEQGKQKVRRSTAEKLARVLDVEPNWIAYHLEDEELYPVGVRLTPSLREKTLPHIRREAHRLYLNPNDVNDLVGAGLEGLVEACGRFDPERGTPLEWWARFISTHRVRDEARRLYRHHPGFGIKPRPGALDERLGTRARRASHAPGRARLNPSVSFRRVSFTITLVVGRPACRPFPLSLTP